MRREEEKVGGEGESRCGRESAGGGRDVLLRAMINI